MWDNNGGTFSAATSTVDLDGTGAQTITGSNSFYGLNIAASSARTIQFESGTTQAIAAGGALSFTGTSGGLLTLAPLTSATDWLLTVAGSASQSISYVSSSYSDASGGAEIDADDGTSTDGGSNTNWNFGSSSQSSDSGSSGDDGGLPELTDPVDNFRESDGLTSKSIHVFEDETFELKVKAVDADQVKNVSVVVAGKRFELLLDNSDVQNPIFVGDVSLASAGTYSYRVDVGYGWTVRRKYGSLVVAVKPNVDSGLPTVPAEPLPRRQYAGRFPGVAGPVHTTAVSQDEKVETEPVHSGTPEDVVRENHDTATLTPMVSPEPKSERKSFMIILSSATSGLFSAGQRATQSVVTITGKAGSAMASVGRNFVGGAQQLVVGLATLDIFTPDEPVHIYDKLTIKLASAEGSPLVGAHVTLHSDPKEGVVDDQGVVEFEQVAAGDHKLEITYEGHTSRQDLVLNQQVSEVTIQITAEFKRDSRFLWF